MTRMTRPDCAVVCNLINTHTHKVSLIPPWEDQCEWHIMTRMAGPDYAVMCNLINTHTHTHPWEDQCEWHRMSRMTGPDCAVMCSLINTHTNLLPLPAREPPNAIITFICEYNQMVRPALLGRVLDNFLQVVLLVMPHTRGYRICLTYVCLSHCTTSSSLLFNLILSQIKGKTGFQYALYNSDFFS